MEMAVEEMRRTGSEINKSSDYRCAGLSVDLLDDGLRQIERALIISAALAFLLTI